MIQEFLRYMSHELNLSVNTVSAYRVDLLQWSDFATSQGKYELAPLTTSASDLRL